MIDTRTIEHLRDDPIAYHNALKDLKAKSWERRQRANAAATPTAGTPEMTKSADSTPRALTIREIHQRTAAIAADAPDAPRFKTYANELARQDGLSLDDARGLMNACVANVNRQVISSATGNPFHAVTAERAPTATAAAQRRLKRQQGYTASNDSVASAAKRRKQRMGL